MNLAPILPRIVCWALLSLTPLALPSAQEAERLSDKDVQALGRACNEYILATDELPLALVTFIRKTAERVKQRMADTGVDRDTAYREIALDWLSDNRRDLERRDLTAVLLLCWWFNKLIDECIGLPDIVRERVSKEDAGDFIKFLGEQTRRKRDAKATADPRHGQSGGASP